MSGIKLAIAVIVAQCLSGQTPKAPGSDSIYAASVQRVLEKYCYACHNEKLKTADLNLEALRQTATAVKQPSVWERVRNKLAAGQMPPSGLPTPTRAESAAVIAWVEAVSAKTGVSANLPNGSPAGVRRAV